MTGFQRIETSQIAVTDRVGRHTFLIETTPVTRHSTSEGFRDFRQEASLQTFGSIDVNRISETEFESVEGESFRLGHG